MNYLYIVLLLVVFLLTIVIGNFLIAKLKVMKMAQAIRTEGPQSHLKKAGTPSMGGIIFLVPIMLATVFFLPTAILPLIGMVLYGGLGIYDDLEKRAHKKNGGLSVKKKFALEIVLGLAVAICAFFLGFGGSIGFSSSYNIQVHPIIYLIFITVFMIAATNSVNFTDGLDGLCTGVSIPVLGVLAVISILKGNISLAMYLGVIIVALLGFLMFNKHPAKIFMGDTGSLALGGLIAAVFIVLKIEVLLLVIGLIYVLETLSVMIQVSYFKFSGGRRVFKMSPLHHHFELSGYQEKQVVLGFTVASIVVSLIGLLIYWSL